LRDFYRSRHGHRTYHPGVSPGSPVNRKQIHLRVEQLSIQFVTRQSSPAAFTEDTQYHLGALHFACLPVSLVSDHLCPFALRTAFPPSLAGRDSCDYYGHCVAIGLTSRRRSHVRLGCTSIA